MGQKREKRGREEGGEPLPNSESKTRAGQHHHGAGISARSRTRRVQRVGTEQSEQQFGQILKLLDAAAADGMNFSNSSTLSGRQSSCSSGCHSYPSQSVVHQTTVSGANSLKKRDGFFMFSLAMHEHIRGKMKGEVTHGQ